MLGRRSSFLQVIRANVGGVPFGHLLNGEFIHLGDETHARLWRKYVCAAGQVLFDNVILRGAAKLALVLAALASQRDVHRQQPHRGAIDCHRGIGLLE